MSSAEEQRAFELTAQIKSCAQSKQLDAALAAFDHFRAEGHAPSKFAHAAIVNAHVNSGDMAGALAAVLRMEQAGFVPNLVVFTTLLKGHCAAGDLHAARALLETMGRQRPPIAPDARTLNTFLRGCVRVGDLDAARWVYSMLGAWRLTPAAPSTVAYGRLLSQGLRLGELRKLLKQQTERLAAPVAHRPMRTANKCMFWERGRCDRGLQCNFYHDPAIRQSDEQNVLAADRDTELELCTHLAHAAALLGRPRACGHALERAEALQQALSDVGAANWAAIELRHDRVYSTLSRMALQAVPNLCVMGGDAATIVRDHLKPRSVTHAFINFPEPPSGYQGLGLSTNALHLLTPAFFTDLRRVLMPEGRLTIFSDNGRYCRDLARTLSELRHPGTRAPLLISDDVPDAPSQREHIGSVTLYHGVPGRSSGHLQSETSYFDRLWEYRQGEATERFFMVLRRA